MRYLRVAVHQNPVVRHPMHQFVVEQGEGAVSRLLEFSPARNGVQAMVFHVEGAGDTDAYEAALAEVETLVEYELSPCVDGSFYLYVREELTEPGGEFVGAFSQPGVVVLMPVEYRADGTVRVTAVGPADTLGNTVDETPDGMTVDVLEVGEYDARRLDATGDLTDRQFEAVVAAVDVGYYENPREGTVAEVAEQVDCAPGTAAELLRRAESGVMSRVVSTGGV